MKKFRFFAMLFLLVGVSASLGAQDSSRFTFHPYADVFMTQNGPVAYPQYAWGLRIPKGTLSGYGFDETAPYETNFTNHLVIYTPSFAKWFSVHTETGGSPNVPTHFFQIGPRVNLNEAVPALKRPMAQLFVAALPRYIGVRPNNLLATGVTHKFRIAPGTDGWLEGYCRFFPDGSYYGEYWVMAHPRRQTSHVSWGLLVHDDSSSPSVSVGIGARISLF